jgi:hypothetical protein
MEYNIELWGFLNIVFDRRDGIFKLPRFSLSILYTIERLYYI